MQIFISTATFLFKFFFINFITKFQFFPSYVKRAAHLWEEGLLIDFLQKKSTDLWIKKFLVVSAYLFNEKIILEHLIHFFNFFVLSYLRQITTLELQNLALTLNLILIFFFLFALFFVFAFLFMFMF